MRHQDNPQDVSKLIKEAVPVFLGDMQFTEEQQEVRTTSNIAGIHKTPANLTTEQLLSQTKEHNKNVSKNPPKLSTRTPRPEVADTEIAFINASYYTVPIEIIAHTLGLTTKRVKELHRQTNHHMLPTIPLLMVTDTSRYLNDEELRDIKDFDDLNHFEDLRTPKELLRIPKEESTNTRILKDYITSNLKEANPQIKLRAIEGYCKLPQDSTEESIGLYGSTECDIARGFKGAFKEDRPETNQLSFINYHTSSYKVPTYKNVKWIYLNHPSYYQKFNYKTPRQSIELANLLIPYIFTHPNRVVENDKNNILALPIFLSAHTNVALNKLIYKPPVKYTINTSNDLTGHNVAMRYVNNLTNIQAYQSEFNDTTNTYTTTTHHQFILPYTNERALGSPILDTNRNLRYTPINLQFLSSVEVTYKSTIKYAIVCHECSSLLSSDTIDHCKHIRIAHKKYKYNLPKRKPNSRPIRITTKYDYMYQDNHKEVFTIYLDTTNQPNYSLHYYTTVDDINYFKIINRDNIPFHEYITKVSPNILPLFTNIQLPVASTLQEPHL